MKPLRGGGAKISLPASNSSFQLEVLKFHQDWRKILFYIEYYISESNESIEWEGGGSEQSITDNKMRMKGYYEKPSG